MPGETPVGVRDQVDHLMHNGVTYKSALFAGRAVHKGIPGIELNGADTGGVKPVEIIIAARKFCARLPGIVIFLHRKIVQGDRAGSAVD